MAFSEGSGVGGARQYAVDAVEPCDRAQALWQVDERQLEFIRAGIAQPRQKRREERRVHVRDFAQVDDPDAFAQVAASLLEDRSDVRQRHRPADYHATAIAANHFFSGAGTGALSEWFFVC